jgi:NADH-quinone oxidoreductase subunit H
MTTFYFINQWIHKGCTICCRPSGRLSCEMTIIGLVFLLFYAVVGLFLVYAERKVCAFMQNRVGPNRVGPYGIFQTIADFIKLLMKELVTIKNSDKLLVQPCTFIVIIASFMAIAAIPFAKGLHAIDFDIGILM